MVKIAHYEVYTDSGDGWRLEDRFSADQRYEAVSLAKEREQARVKVKIIKENFDVQDNTYQETVEYISSPKLASSGAAGTRNGHYSPVENNASSETGEEVVSVSRRASDHTPGAGAALLKLVSIIVISLVLVNLLVTMLTPLVEQFVPEDIIRPIMFAVFFTLFLGITVPVLLTKVPWQAFSPRTAPRRVRPVKEKKIYTKAESIIKWYNLNDEIEPAIAPVFPEAPLEYKKHIVSFLTEIVSQVDSASYLQDSFSKLGIKLIVYGGCFELSRHSGLRLSQANSLLYEAFKILDGDKTDLEAFYEAKKSYNDNKVAIYLTGIGAYLMAQIINDRPLNSALLKKSFDRWEQQNHEITARAEAYKAIETKSEYDLFMDCQVNLQIDIEFLDPERPGLEDVEEHIRGDIRNIIYNLVPKYNGLNVIEEKNITSVRFAKLNTAVRMAIEFYRDVGIFQNEEDDDTYTIHAKCAITEAHPDGAPNLSDFAASVLRQTFDDEIITTEPLKNLYDELDKNKYEFDYLGEKKFDTVEKPVQLYKILYN